MTKSDKKKKKISDKDDIKIVVFGSGGVGKSALIVQLIQGVFVEQYDPTLEDSYRKEVTIMDKQYTLDILDTAGQEEFQSLRDQYIRQGEGYMCVYSITNKTSYEELDGFIEQILSAKELDETESGLKIAAELPIVIVANKYDLVDQQQVSDEDGEKLSQKYGGLKLFHCSAKTRKNVDAAFMEIATQILQKVKSKQQLDEKDKKRCIIQ